MAPRKKRTKVVKEAPPVREEIIDVEEDIVEEDIVEEDIVEEDIVEEDIVEEDIVEEEPTNTPETAVDVVSEKEAVISRIKTNASQFTPEYFDSCKNAGCDYSATGSWQEIYGRMINRLFDLRGKCVLDIGGAFGALANSFLKVGAKTVHCTDISKFAASTRMFPSVKHVHAPVQHMKNLSDETYDFVHISHVLQFVDPLDMERSVREISRVMKSGAVCLIITNDGVGDFKDLCITHIGQTFPLSFDTKDANVVFFKQYKWKCLVVRKD